MKHIVYNRTKDHGVAVCTPTGWILRTLKHGGFFLPLPKMEQQVERQITRGVRPDVAKRYCLALLFGGLDESEAYDLIRERDCAPRGYAIEYMDTAELPDRWFRNAWRRSANGGPIWIDLERAQAVQHRRIQDAYRAADYPKPEMDWRQIETVLARARDAEELRLIWPPTLAKEARHEHHGRHADNDGHQASAQK